MSAGQDTFLLLDCFHLDCQAEARLEAGRAVSVRTRSELNQQAENLETEIRQLEARIAEEKKEAAKVEEIIENSGKKYFSIYIT